MTRFLATMLTGGAHDTTAVCIRDSELVRMSKVRMLMCLQLRDQLKACQMENCIDTALTSGCTDASTAHYRMTQSLRRQTPAIFQCG